MLDLRLYSLHARLAIVCKNPIPACIKVAVVLVMEGIVILGTEALISV